MNDDYDYDYDYNYEGRICFDSYSCPLDDSKEGVDSSKYYIILSRDIRMKMKSGGYVDCMKYIVTEDSGKEYGSKIGDIRVHFPETGDGHCTEIDE